MARKKSAEGRCISPLNPLPVYADRMILLKMMLRLFTTILGTTHPSQEEEGKYAWLLFGLILLIVVAMAAAALVVVKMMR